MRLGIGPVRLSGVGHLDGDGGTGHLLPGFSGLDLLVGDVRHLGHGSPHLLGQLGHLVDVLLDDDLDGCRPSSGRAAADGHGQLLLLLLITSIDAVVAPQIKVGPSPAGNALGAASSGQPLASLLGHGDGPLLALRLQYALHLPLVFFGQRILVPLDLVARPLPLGHVRQGRRIPYGIDHEQIGVGLGLGLDRLGGNLLGLPLLQQFGRLVGALPGPLVHSLLGFLAHA